MELDNYESVKNFLERENEFTKDDINAVCTTILNITDMEQRKEATRLFIENTKEYLLENANELSEEEIVEIINQIRDRLGYNQITRDILLESDFTVDNIFMKISQDQEMDLTPRRRPRRSDDTIQPETTINTDTPEDTDTNEEELEQEQEQEEKEIVIIERRINELLSRLNSNEIEKERIAEKYSEMSLEELEKRLKELNETIENLWNQQVHVENAENPDNSLEELNKQEKELKEAIRQKKVIEKYKDFSNKDLLDILNKYEKEKRLNEKRINELTKELEELDKKGNELWRKVAGEDNGEVPSDELDPINKRIAEIKKELEELKNKKFTITKQEKKERNQARYEELMETVVKLKEYDQILNSSLKRALSQDDKNVLKEDIDTIKKQIAENKEKLDKAHAELNDILFNNTKDVETEIDIEEIKAELDRRLKNKYKGFSTDELLALKTNKNQKIQEQWNYSVHQANGQEDNSTDSLSSLEEELKEIEYELNRRKNELTKEELELLEQLQQIRSAYYTILNEAVEEFKDKTEDVNIEQNIENFVNNHSEIEHINGYEKADKLKKELIEDIKNKLNIKKKTEEPIEKVDNNKKLWLKALAAVTGFATGLGVSCIPGVGTIGMIAAGLKLGTAAVNFFAKRNPEGTCAKIKNFSEEQVNKLTGKLENRYPGITEKVANMRAKLKESPLNVFINGVSAGYLVGNIIELTTGKNVFEHIKSWGNGTGDLVTAPNVTDGDVTKATDGDIPKATDGDIPKVTDGDTIGSYDPTTKPGPHPEHKVTIGSTPRPTTPSGVYDLSSIPEGFSSSYSNSPVNLITSSGKSVTFDKANFVNGEEWWHFLKPDGEGYAWFKADDVRHIVEGATKTGGRSI